MAMCVLHSDEELNEYKQRFCDEIEDKIENRF